MASIYTTHGLLDETLLARTVGFEDRPNAFVVWVEWRLGEELVKRDCWITTKEPGVVATALVGST